MLWENGMRTTVDQVNTKVNELRSAVFNLPFEKERLNIFFLFLFNRSMLTERRGWLALWPHSTRVMAFLSEVYKFPLPLCGFFAGTPAPPTVHRHGHETK